MDVLPSNNRVGYRNIIQSDFEEYYGVSRSGGTVRGFSFFYDGELVGIAGIECRQGMYYIFSEFHDNIDVMKSSIWRCTKMVINMVNSLKVDVIAEANPFIDRSKLFLERLGFERLDGLYIRRYKDDRS